MAPENIHAASFWLDNHRHSPRIFNKNAMKFDISTVNSKIDFMRSLDLFCVKSSYAKANWEVLLPKDSIPLKKCSVVINDVKCNYCEQSLKNQKDIDHHKSIHRQFEQKIPALHKKGMNDLNCNTDLKDEMVYGNIIECNNNDETLKNVDKMKSDKKVVQRKKDRKSVTKVTLKIGGEVISKVYCKRKYLNKNGPKDQNSCENCKNCNEINNRLQTTKKTSKSTNTSLSRNRKSNDDLSNREARIRKMAALLVEHEVQRKALQDLNNSRKFKKDSRELFNDDAVVPELNKETNFICDDGDIHEILFISKLNDINKIKSNSGAPQPSNASDDIRRNDICTAKCTEIITIDDEFSDDSANDCIIINEYLGTKNNLINEENSYIFHIAKKDIGAVSTQKNDSSAEKRTSVNNFTPDIFKKRKLENVYTQYNTNATRNEKENKHCQLPAINVGQLLYH